MASKAGRACSTCSSQKRRCDKLLPRCSACVKNGRYCDYVRLIHSHLPPVASADCPASPSEPQQHNTQRTFGSSAHSHGHRPIPAKPEFPSSFFLDYDVFKLQGLGLPRGRNAVLPPELLAFCQPAEVLRDRANAYFDSTHLFFPIVSKIRLFQELSAPHIEPDTLILTIAMQLHVLGPEGLWRNEINSALSIRLLQSQILTALYETAHAMYPEAYLTIGQCARTGQLMGIHSAEAAPQLLGRLTAAVDAEERQRTWWGVVILDRHVNLGGGKLPLACADAAASTFLPIEDSLWDQGELGPILPVLGSHPGLHTLSPFARMCQAANFLSRVYKNLELRGIDASIRHADALQLHDDIRALSGAIEAEAQTAAKDHPESYQGLKLFAARGMCFSALLTLYDEYSCAASSQPSDGVDAGWLEMQKRSVSGLRQLTEQISQLDRDIRGAAEAGHAVKVCPLAANSLYGLAYMYLWYAHETGDISYRTSANIVRSTLQLLGQTWRSANEYTKLLEFYETLVAGA